MKKSLFTLFYLLLFSFISNAQISGWNHFETITLHEESGSTINNYQLRIELNTQAFISANQMNIDGSDIRFSSICTGGTMFPYWIESGINSDSTVIWVKIDTLTANSYKTIYLHYGNTSATAISAVNGTFFGPHSATDSVSGTNSGGVTDSQRGFRFSPNEDILVTDFGKNEPNGTTRYITLFDNTTQTIMRQIQVSGPAAQYSYGSIGNPIWLTQGTQYIIELFQGSSDGYYYGASGQAGQHITYLDMRYCNGCDQNTFPTNSLGNIHYGYEDFWYYTKTNVSPAPTYSLTGNGLNTNLPASINICQYDSIQLPLTILGGTAPFTFTWTGNYLSDSTIQVPVAYPTDTLIYTVSVADACGSHSNDTIQINIKPLPLVTVQSTIAVLCPGEYTELTVNSNSNYSYLWSDSTTSDTLVVSPSTTTNYSVTVTDTNLCSYTDSISVSVQIPVIADQQVSICYGTSYSIGTSTYTNAGTYIDTIAGISTCDSIVTTHLTIEDEIDADIQWVGLNLVADVGGDSYYWIDCSTNTPISGATSPIYEVTANGSYAVVVKSGNCSKTSDCFELTNLDIASAGEIENIRIYPNPTSGLFNIQCSSEKTLTICNSLGQLIKTVQILPGQTLTIDLSGEGKGMYLIYSGTKVNKIIVE